MWLKYGTILLILQAVHCNWENYGNIDMYFEPSIYILEMPLRKGVELQMHAKDFHRVQGVDVETAERVKVAAEVNGNLIRITNPPEFICLTFRLELDFIARRCLFVQREFGRLDMSFSLHVESLNDSTPSYRMQWRSSEDEVFSILVYNTTHIKQFTQKTSLTALYNLRPGTTYVICISSNAGRLHHTCSTWRTNHDGLNPERAESTKSSMILAEVGGMGDTWTLLVWRPAKTHIGRRILAPEAYLLLAQQMGSKCPDQMIHMLQTTTHDSVKETTSVVDAIKSAYFVNCMNMKEIERFPPCSSLPEDTPYWIDGIPYKNIVGRNKFLEFTFKGLARNSAYNFTVIPLVPFLEPSSLLHLLVSVLGQTGTSSNYNSVAGLVLSVLCLLGILGVIVYLLLDRYLLKKGVIKLIPQVAQSGNDSYGEDCVCPRSDTTHSGMDSHTRRYVFQRPQAALPGSDSCGEDYLNPRPADETKPYGEAYALPTTIALPSATPAPACPTRNAAVALPEIPGLLPEKKSFSMRISLHNLISSANRIPLLCSPCLQSLT